MYTKETFDLIRQKGYYKEKGAAILSARVVEQLIKTAVEANYTHPIPVVVEHYIYGTNTVFYTINDYLDLVPTGDGHWKSVFDNMFSCTVHCFPYRITPMDGGDPVVIDTFDKLKLRIGANVKVLETEDKVLAYLNVLKSKRRVAEKEKLAQLKKSHAKPTGYVGTDIKIKQQYITKNKDGYTIKTRIGYLTRGDMNEPVKMLWVLDYATTDGNITRYQDYRKAKNELNRLRKVRVEFKLK